jgi:hypothetical protein
VYVLPNEKLGSFRTSCSDSLCRQSAASFAGTFGAGQLDPVQPGRDHARLGLLGRLHVRSSLSLCFSPSSVRGEGAHILSLLPPPAFSPPDEKAESGIPRRVNASRRSSTRTTPPSRVSASRRIQTSSSRRRSIRRSGCGITRPTRSSRPTRGIRTASESFLVLPLSACLAHGQFRTLILQLAWTGTASRPFSPPTAASSSPGQRIKKSTPTTSSLDKQCTNSRPTKVGWSSLPRYAPRPEKSYSLSYSTLLKD